MQAKSLDWWSRKDKERRLCVSLCLRYCSDLDHWRANFSMKGKEPSDLASARVDLWTDEVTPSNRMPEG